MVHCSPHLSKDISVEDKAFHHNKPVLVATGLFPSEIVILWLSLWVLYIMLRYGKWPLEVHPLESFPHTRVLLGLSVNLWQFHPFKNTSYLLVKIAHRFSLENSQNLHDPRGIAPGVLPQYIACATLDLGSPDEYVWDSHSGSLARRCSSLD